MSRHQDWDISCKVYVGNLPDDASREEIEDAFSKYGPLKNVWVARSPPGFGFVEFEDPRDAEDAARSLDGTRLCGNRVKVEMSNGQTRDNYRGRGSRGGRDRWTGRSNYTREWAPRGRRDERYGGRRSRSRSRDRGSRRRRSPSYRSMSRSRSRSESPPRRGRGGGGGGRSRSGSRSE